MRKMNPPLRTVCLFPGSPLAAGKYHLILIGIETGLGVIVGREVNIDSQRRGMTIVVHIREASSSALVVRVLDADAVEGIRVSGVRWWVI